MPCWDMLHQLDCELPQLKLTYHVQIYPHYPPEWVQLGTYLDQTIDLDLEAMSQPWETSHWIQEVQAEQWSQTLKQSRRI